MRPSASHYGALLSLQHNTYSSAPSTPNSVSAFDESFVDEDSMVLDDLHIAHSSSHWMRVACNSVFFILAVVVGFLVIHKEGEVLAKLYHLRHTSARFTQSNSTTNSNNSHLGE